MTATVWTTAGCGACAEEKRLLKAEGYDIREIEVEDDASMDRDAFAQIQIQYGMFPVIKIGDEFRIPASIASKMDWNT